MATKRKPTKPEGASLREAAAALGITRAALLKHIDRGLPAPLVRERRTVDVAAARAWIAEQEALPVTPSRAAVLHPSDPRYLQSATAAKVKGFQLALAQRNMVEVKAAAARAATALADLNARLNAMPSSLADLRILNRHNAQAVLGPLVDDVLSEFTPDDPEHWQDSPFEADDGEDPEPFEEKIYLPVLPYSDPRAAVARMNAAKWQAELDRLESSSIGIEDVRRILREQCDKVRAAVRKIPGRIATRLADDNPAHVVREAMLFEIDSAKHEAVKALGAKPTWTPSPPTTPDEMEDDDCNVSGEFESEPAATAEEWDDA